MSRIAKKISKFTKREIDHLFKHAHRAFKGKECVVLLARAQQDFGRVLISVSRKVGNAPERNLIRRRIKSIFYEESLYEQAFDCAMIIYKPMVLLSFEQLKRLMLSTYLKV